MLTLGKNGELTLLLFTIKFGKTPQEQCNKQVNGEHIYPIYI